ncbi:hypothetical protein [Carnobacterium inhibens]|uniref:hypothetical protein n=1 Tax=Carnobacterium inhibens TaxID=147709 RepID=UPI00054EF8AE|nr:hypothetical protein [Carnobacterium inhibens]
MSLIDQIKEIKDESYDKWFERWYRKQNLENAIIQSAKQGYGGFTIRIKETYESESDWKKERKYLVRRLRDSRTPINIQSKLGEGFTVKHKFEVYHGKLLGMSTRRTEDWISIRWEVPNDTSKN